MTASDPRAVAATAPSAPFTARQWAFLALIAVLGTWLRLLRLDAWSFWVDEAHTWRDATLPAEVFWDCNRSYYPTSYLLLRWLLDVADPNTLTEGMLRLPFAIAGAISVPVLALIGRPMVGRPSALLASLLLAINPWHIYWSQNARSYVLVFLFAMLTGGAFWIGVHRKNAAMLVLSVLALGLGISCHPTAGLVSAPLVVYLFVANRRPSKRAVVGACAAFAAGLAAVEVLSTVPPFHEFVRSKAGPGLGHLLQTTAFYFRPSLLLVAAVGSWLMLTERPRGRSLYLTLWALVPLLALAVLGTHLVKVTARYAICTLPAILLLCGVACVRIGNALKAAFAESQRWGRIVPAMVLPAIVCLDMAAYDFLYFTVQKGDRGQWHAAADLIHDEVKDGPVLVLTVNEPTLQFYLRRWHYAPDRAEPADSQREVVSIETHLLANAGGAPEWFESMRKRSRESKKPLYAVVSVPELREKDPDSRLQHAFHTEMELIAVFPNWVGPKDETIFVYREHALR
ncbi:MAG: glycosyltransferase family 39 protein [Planctomycetota bacterium]